MWLCVWGGAGINKRRQALSEKVNKGTDKTEFDPGFVELEKVGVGF